MIMKGKVYIASMNLRGEWASLPNKNIKRVNVTSAQRKKNPFRIAFSPMTEIEGGYKGYNCFENYWQSGKRYEGFDKKDTIEQIKWWKKQSKGKRKYPKGKNKKVLYSTFDENNKKLNYIESRKKIYVPEYFNLIKNKRILNNLKKELEQGKDIAIYDFDGVRTNKGNPTIKELSLELLKIKINDAKHIFGHGYIVGSYLLGLEPKDYI